MRSAAVMPAVSDATASFHLRLSATASKALVRLGAGGGLPDDLVAFEPSEPTRPTFNLQTIRLESISYQFLG